MQMLDHLLLRVRDRRWGSSCGVPRRVQRLRPQAARETSVAVPAQTNGAQSGWLDVNGRIMGMPSLGWVGTGMGSWARAVTISAPQIGAEVVPGWWVKQVTWRRIPRGSQRAPWTRWASLACSAAVGLRRCTWAASRPTSLLESEVSVLQIFQACPVPGVAGGLGGWRPPGVLT